MFDSGDKDKTFKMKKAFSCMSSLKNKRKLTPKQYEILKKYSAECMSLSRKGNTPWNKGKKASVSTREKMSKSAQKRSKNTISIFSTDKNPSYKIKNREKASKRMTANNPFKGKKHSQETIAKIKENNERTNEIRSQKLSGVNNPNYGKKMSEEQKETLSILRSKSVSDGTTIYKSIKEASQKTGKATSTISYFCKNKKYGWNYVD